MRATVIYGPGDIRVEDRSEPSIVEPTDAVVRTVASCVCGSDLWRYRGIADVPRPTPIGHEYVGIVEAVGNEVSTIRPGQFVVGGFLHSDNTCAVCKRGMQSHCPNGGGYDGCQAEAIRIPNADGTLIATPEHPDDDMIPGLLALSDVMATGWHAAVSANVRPGGTVVVVGDGAVGLCGVLSAAQLGADRIIAMSRHTDRQTIARHFGATDIVAERGDAGVEQILDLTDGIGADSVLECVGTEDSVLQALRSAPRRVSRLGRRPARDRHPSAAHVLAQRRPAWRPGPRTGLSARPAPTHPRRPDQARDGVRPDPPPRTGCGRIRRHGPTPFHQVPSPTVSGSNVTRRPAVEAVPSRRWRWVT